MNPGRKRNARIAAAISALGGAGIALMNKPPHTRDFSRE